MLHDANDQRFDDVRRQNLPDQQALEATRGPLAKIRAKLASLSVAILSRGVSQLNPLDLFPRHMLSSYFYQSDRVLC